MEALLCIGIPSLLILIRITKSENNVHDALRALPPPPLFQSLLQPIKRTMDVVADVLQPVVEFVVTLAHLLFLTLVDIVKACLPIGVLPRKSIKGDVCLITGSGSGLGRLMALEFARHGCDIVLWDINEAGNAETKKMLDAEGTGAKVWSYKVDLSDRKEIAAKAAQVKNDVGRVDILVNNAGIVTGKKIFDCPDELMEKTMAVNCMSNLYTMKHFGQSMIERNHGHIVTIASIAGKRGVAGLVDYCAAKHGAVGFHESISDELRFQGIEGVKTSLICPYYINTGMFDGVVTNAPNLLPILEPEYVISCIMEAVLTDKQEYYMPRFLYIVIIFEAIFSTASSKLMTAYFKIAETMNDFKGRQPAKH